MSEQLNPWDLLQPQDVTSRHRGAKPPRRYELLGVISLLSRRTFYPLSDGPSTRNHRITISVFRPCWLVGLTVKHPYAIALYARLPSVLRVPLKASDTILEATTPVKLPTKQCLPF